MGSEDVSAKVAVAIHGFCKLHKYVINLLQEGSQIDESGFILYSVHVDH